MTINLAIESSTTLTEEEYLGFERSSEIKHEYLSGHVYAMVGATRKHNLIIWNVASALHRQLRGNPCEAYINDMRVKIPKTGDYTYPDIVVVCETPLLSDDYSDTLINPLLIIEVLSPSTEAYDRGEKFKRYRSIESFSEYVLIAQDKMAADHFVKQNNIWTILEVDQEIRLVTIDCLLTFPEIYDRVELASEK